MSGESSPCGQYPIRDIFSIAFDQYRAGHSLREEQTAAARCIIRCKTGELGHNYYECAECGHIMKVPRSCGNRNCPNCQAVAKAAWLEERKGELIDAPYFHIVGTLPHELNPLIAANRKILYELLHRSMGVSLVQLANDPKYLGATPGIVQILHTWDQQMRYHVHVHCVVSGGGLTKDKKLVTLPRDASFFIPVKALAAMYRGRFMAGLKEYRLSGKLVYQKDLEDAGSWEEFLDSLYKKDWNVYIKQTFNGNGNAIEYLSKYTNRIAISNKRILSFTDKDVTFSYTDRKDGGKKKTETISSEIFIGRFLQHVLPKGFQKIRYYGFLNNSTRKKNLEIIFAQQGGMKYRPRFTRSSPADVVMAAAWGQTGRKCPHCGKGTMGFVVSSRELSEMASSLAIKTRAPILEKSRGQPA